MRCDSVRDRIWGILLILVNLPMSMPTPEWLWGTKFYLPELICSTLVLVIMVALLVDGTIDFVGYIKHQRWRYLLRTERKLAGMPHVPQWEE